MNEQDFQKVLWDIDKKNRASLPVSFIIQRTLSYGGVSLLFKVIRMYGVNVVKQVFIAMKPTSIPFQKYNYIKNFLLP